MQEKSKFKNYTTVYTSMVIIIEDTIIVDSFEIIYQIHGEHTL